MPAALILVSIFLVVGALFAFAIVYWIRYQRKLNKLYRESNCSNYFEFLVYCKLRKLPEEYKIFNNLLLLHNGKSTQIDHLVVSPYGIFVIEDKDYKGQIYGAEKVFHWKQYLHTSRYNTTCYKFYNPIKQNEGHINELRKILRNIDQQVFVPIVVFSSRAELRVNAPNNLVIYFPIVHKIVQEFKTVVYSKDEIEQIIAKINQMLTTKAEDIDEHIKNAQICEQNAQQRIANNLCPQCGSPLVERNGKFGTFWGCSNYPKCRYIRKKH